MRAIGDVGVTTVSVSSTVPADPVSRRSATTSSTGSRAAISGHPIQIAVVRCQMEAGQSVRTVAGYGSARGFSTTAVPERTARCGRGLTGVNVATVQRVDVVYRTVALAVGACRVRPSGACDCPWPADVVIVSYSLREKRHPSCRRKKDFFCMRLLCILNRGIAQQWAAYTLPQMLSTINNMLVRPWRILQDADGLTKTYHNIQKDVGTEFFIVLLLNMGLITSDGKRYA